MKKRMKKVATLCLAGVTAMSTVGVTGSAVFAKGDTNYDVDNMDFENVELRVAFRFNNGSDTDGQAKWYYKALDEFNKENEGKIHVTDESISTESDYEEKLTTDFASGNVPNAFLQYGGSRTREYVDAGYILDLTPYFEQYPEWKEGVQDFAWETTQFDGIEGTYGIPWSAYQLCLYYNKDYLDQVGVDVPESWDDLVDACAKLKDAGIGTYILFQETYHKESYETLHPTGPKHNYAYHTEAMDRAMEGGIDDVGLGVLFGLELYRYEFAGLLMHAEHLEAVHGVGPHTISVPRIKHADDIDPSAFDNSISDEIFAKICALIRIAVPYTGMIISTRESKAVREKVLPLGVSQISGASRTSVGGYDVPETEDEVTSAQFDVSDQRSLDEIVNWLMGMGDIPSFCTACYRAGRTGDRFMSLCKSKQISNCCHPNALMTLMEYLQDYASPETKKVGLELIQKELENIPGEKIRKLTEEHLADIVNGQRDFRF